MMKHRVSGAQLDLKQFFEASVNALQTYGVTEKSSQTIRHNCALVQRTQTSGARTNRAMADAARALSALWRA